MIDEAANAAEPAGLRDGGIGASAASADIVTQSGVALHIRPAVPGDESLLATLFSQVSPEDLRFRFASTKAQVAQQDLARMLPAADGKTTTFLALLADGVPVGAATLADDPDGKTAEVALSVHSAWKKKGVAWTLLDHTLRYASAHGLKEVKSFESGDNRAAINLEHEMGFVARLVSASPVELSLSKNVSAD